MDDLLIPELAMFPYGKRDDLVDSTMQALSFLRSTGRIRTDAEAKADELDGVTHRSPRRRLYPV
jgi:hypothetical protein